MAKYDKMLECNKEYRDQKQRKAVNAIRQMLKKNERVSVKKLEKNTGLSRSYFYQNSTVHIELVEAQKKQQGKTYVPQKNVIITKAVEEEINYLRKKVEEQEETIKKLQAQLKKEKNKKLVSILDEL